MMGEGQLRSLFMGVETVFYVGQHFSCHQYQRPWKKSVLMGEVASKCQRDVAPLRPQRADNFLCDAFYGVADIKPTLRKYEEKRGTFVTPFDDIGVIYGFQMMTYLKTAER
jgi:hypothetical protein